MYPFYFIWYYSCFPANPNPMFIEKRWKLFIWYFPICEISEINLILICPFFSAIYVHTSAVAGWGGGIFTLNTPLYTTLIYRIITWAILQVIGGDRHDRLIPVPYSKSTTDQAVSSCIFRSLLSFYIYGALV